MNGTVPPSSSNPITALIPRMLKFKVREMLRMISGERFFFSAMGATGLSYRLAFRTHGNSLMLRIRPIRPGIGAARLRSVKDRDRPGQCGLLRRHVDRFELLDFDFQRKRLLNSCKSHHNFALTAHFGNNRLGSLEDAGANPHTH